MAAQKVYTDIIQNETVVFDQNSSLRAVSFVLISGTATVTGTLTVNGRASQAIPLVESQPVTFGIEYALPIESLTVNASAGTVYVIGRG